MVRSNVVCMTFVWRAEIKRINKRFGSQTSQDAVAVIERENNEGSPKETSSRPMLG